MPRRSAPQHGVSLIEALVALAVMAFGMLAVAGIQVGLRANADTAKQRAEAVRIAQEAIEDWRAFSVIQTTDGHFTDWGDIATTGATSADFYTSSNTNAEYMLGRTVLPSTDDDPNNDALLKTLVVDVVWLDRRGDEQSVQLRTAIARIEPELVGSLAVPSPPGAAPPGAKRHPAVPFNAKPLDIETSGLKPQPDGTVVWRFDNVTGLIISVCTVEASVPNEGLTLDLLSSCVDTGGQYVGGVVRFATSTITAPDAAAAENPTSTALNLDVVLNLTSTGHPAAPVCFDDAPADSTTTETLVRYHCLVYANATRTWSGRSEVVPAAFSDASTWTVTSGGTHKICRYTTLYDREVGGVTVSGDIGPNIRHPRNYVDVGVLDVMRNQNFLVIAAAWACPTDVPVDLVASNYVNSNTRQHQPAP